MIDVRIVDVLLYIQTKKMEINMNVRQDKHKYQLYCKIIEAMYYKYKRNIEPWSLNYCCRGLAISITYSECMCIFLLSGIPSACTLLYCHMWSLWLSTIFPHYLISDTILYIKNVTEHKMCFFFIFCTSFAWNISHSKKNSARVCHTFA